MEQQCLMVCSIGYPSKTFTAEVLPCIGAGYVVFLFYATVQGVVGVFDDVGAVLLNLREAVLVIVLIGIALAVVDEIAGDCPAAPANSVPNSNTPTL